MKKIVSIFLILVMSLSFVSVFAEDITTDNNNVINTRGGASVAGGSSGASSVVGGASGGGGVIAVVSKKTYNFVGTVSLPNGEIAEKDIPVTIYINGTDIAEASGMILLSGSPGGLVGGQSGGVVVVKPGGSMIESPVETIQSFNTVIPKGENSIEYETTWRIATSYSYAYAEAEIESDIYIQRSKSDIILLDETTENTLDIELDKPECYISGTFSLGESAETLPDDMNIKLYLSDPDTEYYKYKYVYKITLPANKKEVDFSLPAMYGDYKFSYSALAEGINQQHISDDVYTYEEIISADTDVSGIMLECKFCDLIEGVLKLPDSMVAGEGGVDVEIRAGKTITVKIPEGQNFINYTVAHSEYIHFTQVNADVYDVHFKGFYKTTNGDISTITLEPIFTMAGKITFNEPVEDGENIEMTVECDGKFYIYSDIEYEVGDMSADYYIDLSEYSSKVAIGDDIDISIDRNGTNIYFSFNKTLENAKIFDYVSIYNFDVDLIKRAEIIKGVINLPDDFDENRIYIRATNGKKWLNDSIYLSGDEKTVDFALVADSENISAYNGDYELSVSFGEYSGYDLYYNNGELSFDKSTKINVKNDVTNLELTIPEQNQYFKGTVILPEPCNGDITVNVSVTEKSTSEYAGNREFTIPAGDMSANFEVGYLLKNTEYIVSYSIYGGNIAPYYGYMEVFVTEDGCSQTQEDAKSYFADGRIQIIDLDFAPLVCSSKIEGTITIPFGVVPASSTYFDVEITAKCGDREEYTYVKFNAGDIKKEYSISIPELYRNSSWKLSYKIGEKTEIPYAPSGTVLQDSSFRRINGGSSGGGSGYNITYNVVPSKIVKGIDVYYSADGVTYDKTKAEDIVLSDTEVYKADIVIGTTHTEHMRKIGGYFCAVDSGISVIIQLYDIVDRKVLDTARITSDDKYEFYELETYSLNDVVIKYIYDGKEVYYSEDGELTESIDEAKRISVQSNPVQYGYDVNKNNVYYKNFNDRYFSYTIEDGKYDCDDIEIKLYDMQGNVLQSARGREGCIDMNTAQVFIGFEFGGKTYYFAGKPKYYYYNPTLGFVVENIEDAYPYRIPHESYSVNVTIDMSDFTAGWSGGADGNVINEAYFKYSKSGNCTDIESLYIDATDEMFEENKTVFIAFYNSSGRLRQLKKITEIPSGNIVPVDYKLYDGGYVKILVWESNFKPIIDVIKFFGE